VLLCSLSNFDAYQVTRTHRAPKPFAFAVKSTDNLSFFENTADYLHSFACSEKDGKIWMEKILVARVSPSPIVVVFFSLEFELNLLSSLMFFSKNDMFYSTRKLSAVMLLVCLVLGPERRRFKDPITTFSNLVLFFQNNCRLSLSLSFFSFICSFVQTHHAILLHFIDFLL
jgi:hypothetical protein